MPCFRWMGDEGAADAWGGGEQEGVAAARERLQAAQDKEKAAQAAADAGEPAAPSVITDTSSCGVRRR